MNESARSRVDGHNSWSGHRCFGSGGSLRNWESAIQEDYRQHILLR